jgi:hypothetical protein
MELPMPRGDKSSYSDKQKRMAEHIEEGYEKSGTPRDEAEKTRGGKHNLDIPQP